MNFWVSYGLGDFVDENSSITDTIINLSKSLRDKILYICGAGASISLCKHKLTFDEIINLAKKKLTKSLEKKLNEELSKFKFDIFSKASKVFNTLKSNNLEIEFMDNNIESMKPQDLCWFEFINYATLIGDCFATTNFDTSIEKVANSQTITYKDVNKVNYLRNRYLGSGKILHMNGAYSKNNNLSNHVITEEDFNNLNNNTKYKKQINKILTSKKRTIIMIGCPSIFCDKVHAEIFNKISTQKTNKILYLYCEEERNGLNYLPNNITKVCYGKTYDQLPVFLSILSQFRILNKVWIQGYRKKKKNQLINYLKSSNFTLMINYNNPKPIFSKTAVLKTFSVIANLGEEKERKIIVITPNTPKLKKSACIIYLRRIKNVTNLKSFINSKII